MSGLTTTGFVAATVEEILAEIVADQLALIDPALDTDPDTQLGQINGIVSSKFAEIWELLEVSFGAFDDTKAEDTILDALCAITGTVRPGDTKGHVVIHSLLTIGTVLPTNARVTKAGDPSNAWVIAAPYNVTPYVAAATAEVDLLFECAIPGIIEAPATTLTVIATPVSGWGPVINALDATPGRLRALDEELRILRRAEIPAQGGSSTPALRAALLKVPGVISARAIENATSSIVDGRPPHSVEGIIWDGVAPAALDADVRAVVFDNTSAGIESDGDILGYFVDEYKNSHLVKFSRAVQIPITIVLSVTTTTDFPVDGVDQIKAKIVAAGLLFDIGQTVIRLNIMALALQVAGVVDVPTCTIEDLFSGPLTTNIPIGDVAIATFDTGRITVT